MARNKQIITLVLQIFIFLCCYVLSYLLIHFIHPTEVYYTINKELSLIIIDYYGTTKYLTNLDLEKIGMFSVLSIIFFFFILISIILITKESYKKNIKALIIVLFFFFPTITKEASAARYSIEPSNDIEASAYYYLSVKPFGIAFYNFLTQDNTNNFQFITFNQFKIDIELFDSSELYIGNFKPTKHLVIEFLSVIVSLLSMFYVGKYFINKNKNII